MNSFLKTITNPISIGHKLFLTSYTEYKPPVTLSNLFNANMNNIMAIDYCNKDITGSDGVLSRWTQEYPKISSNFKVKTKN